MTYIFLFAALVLFTQGAVGHLRGQPQLEPLEMEKAPGLSLNLRQAFFMVLGV